jgi:transcriptional regulator with XRE-family HTH domain
MSEMFAGRLRELRTQAGLSQTELAEKAGLTKDGIAQLEQGRRSPSWDTVLALCAALGVECMAFTQEPETEGKRRRGRPRKTEGTASNKAITTSKQRRKGR